MKFQMYLVLFLLALGFNACGAIEGDDFNFERIKQIDVSDAESLGVILDDITNYKTLIKFNSETGEPENVKFYDENKEELNFSFQFILNININDTYLVTFLGQFNYPELAFLVNKTNNDVHVLAIANESETFPMHDNVSFKSDIFLADQYDNIYYVSNSQDLVKVNTQDLDNIKKQIISNGEEDIFHFAVSKDGDIAYIAYQYDLVNNEVSKIIFSDGTVNTQESFTHTWVD